MMIKLTAEQISIYWDTLQYVWLQTNPPPKGVSPTQYLNLLLENLLSDVAQAWIIYEGEGDTKSVIAVGISSICRDEISGLSTIVIKCLYGFRKLDNDIAMRAFEDFKTYARNTGASQVKLFTNVPRVKELATLCKCVKTSEVFTLDLKVGG